MSVAAETVPNEYIVVFKQHVPNEVRQDHCEWVQSAHAESLATRDGGGEVTGLGKQFSFPTLTGYVGSFDPSLKDEIEGREEVDFVEPNYVVYASGLVTQDSVPSWGLARISSTGKLTADTQKTYTYDSSAGEGTTAYIVDTGILATHEDFGGRAVFGYNAVPGSPNTDKAGHGTHVAGTIGGTKYGVAKKASLVGVKVLGDNGSGSTSGVITGLQWAAEDAQKKGIIKKSVANMSLGGPKSVALNQAVANVVRLGLTVVVAAGNGASDASAVSPASEPSAVTVGSIEISDNIASSSNFGKSVDIFGPGRNITSTWCDSNTSTKAISGTSMASPHIAGLALYLIAKKKITGGPSEVAKALTSLAAKNSKVFPVVSGTTGLISFNGEA